MKTRYSILDSAFVISALTAVLFFWGVVNVEGDASALGLPREFLSRDLWGTVGYGAEGFFAHTLLLPYVFFRDSALDWRTIFSFLAATVAILAVAILFRRWAYRFVLVLFTAIAAFSVHITVASNLDMGSRIAAGIKCVSKQNCEDRTPLQNRVIFTKSKDALDERTGIIMSANNTFMVMLTERGYLVVPMSKIILLETAGATRSAMVPTLP